jgi:hypothetical protein
MTTQYDPSLPREEMMDGVKVIRVPVAARVSKGVLAPTFGWVATKLIWQHDVVQMHLPQFDAPGVALRGRLFGKPAVLTYHCDVQLPPGFSTARQFRRGFSKQHGGDFLESHRDLHTGLRGSLSLPLALRLQTDPDPASR